MQIFGKYSTGICSGSVGCNIAKIYIDSGNGLATIWHQVSSQMNDKDHWHFQACPLLCRLILMWAEVDSRSGAAQSHPNKQQEHNTNNYALIIQQKPADEQDHVYTEQDSRPQSHKHAVMCQYRTSTGPVLATHSMFTGNPVATRF